MDTSNEKIVNLNVKTYRAYREENGLGKGNPKSKLPTKRELVGYVPMEKRVTALMAAGIRTASERDEQFFDTINSEGIPPMPPLPRHMPADLAEVSDLAREYQERRRIIEARLEEARQKLQEGSGVTPKDDSGGTPPAQAAQPQ